MGNYSVVVLDFETTGLSPDYGDRAIEIGAVLIENNRITERFSRLMNPGKQVSRFIEEYTGITNAMLAKAPPVDEVMHEFSAFMANHPLVAHNASFDRRFLDAELRRIGCQRSQEMACSLLVSRRVYPDAPGHSLESLVRYKELPNDGVHHRALADAEMTGYLWTGIVRDLKSSYDLAQVPFELLQELSKVKKSAAQALLQRFAAQNDAVWNTINSGRTEKEK